MSRARNPHDLDPCPFCGHPRPEQDAYTKGLGIDQEHAAFVSCPSCWAQGPIVKHRPSFPGLHGPHNKGLMLEKEADEQAAKLWNRTVLR